MWTWSVDIGITSDQKRNPRNKKTKYVKEYRLNYSAVQNQIDSLKVQLDIQFQLRVHFKKAPRHPPHQRHRLHSVSCLD